ncbi:MAG TPA: hypothetical protein VEL28_04760 [Candidatus Binatia bacterium]|nr:hypothetical protein [Candidatus Binatia bacterium]
MRTFRAAMLAATLLWPGISAATTAYDIDVKITNSQSYETIDLTVNYSGANGGFSGSGSTVSCTPNATLNATTSFNDVAPNLKSGTMRTTQFAGPVVLYTCIFDANAGAPTAGQFVITIRDWTSSSTSTAPTVQISRIALH